ncbi:MAG: hypothetical protein KJ588_04045, partial [Gammaproteobacteria bacterium]|nr:hypothetical protein [Gammaproteobacteria bacterium]
SILLIYKKTKEQKEYVLVVLPGDASVDLQKLADLKGWNKNKISFANSDAVLQHTGFPAGGTPPIGHKEPLAVVMNKRLLDLDVGYAGGGKPEWLLKISPKEIQRLTCAQLL